tara:strand:+ start:244 stop:990 length:747 start_codon:yes stop_codon:yes gene_type:complete
MKIINYLILFSVLAIIVVSCSKSDDDDDSTSSADPCTANISGSFAIGSDTISGKYNMYDGSSTTPECIDNSSSSWSNLLTGGAPFGNTGNTSSLQLELVITSASSYEKRYAIYSDTSCSTAEGYFILGYDNLTIGSSITASATSNDQPATAYPATSNWQCLGIYSTTDNLTSYYNTYATGFLTSGSIETGAEKHWNLSDDNSSERNAVRHSLWGMSTGSTTRLVFGDHQTSGAHDNWSTSTTSQYNDL